LELDKPGSREGRQDPGRRDGLPNTGAFAPEAVTVAWYLAATLNVTIGKTLGRFPQMARRSALGSQRNSYGARQAGVSPVTKC